MKSIDKFIDEIVTIYKLAQPTVVERRELKYKLGMADIHDNVANEDTPVALDIVLGSIQKKRKPMFRTASVYSSVSVGTCPRCGARLAQAKLTDSRGIGYCEACQVAVPTS